MEHNLLYQEGLLYFAKRNHCETKPLRNETIAKRDFKHSSTLMIVFY